MRYIFIFFTGVCFSLGAMSCDLDTMPATTPQQQNMVDGERLHQGATIQQKQDFEQSFQNFKSRSKALQEDYRQRIGQAKKTLYLASCMTIVCCPCLSTKVCMTGCKKNDRDAMLKLYKAACCWELEDN